MKGNQEQIFDKKKGLSNILIKIGRTGEKKNYPNLKGQSTWLEARGHKRDSIPPTK